MHPSIYIYDAKHLKSANFVDSMEYKHEHHYEIGGAATQEPLPLENINICSKRVLLDVCSVDDSIDSVYISVELNPKVCYVNESEPLYKPEMQ